MVSLIIGEVRGDVFDAAGAFAVRGVNPSRIRQRTEKAMHKDLHAACIVY